MSTNTNTRRNYSPVSKHREEGAPAIVLGYNDHIEQMRAFIHNQLSCWRKRTHQALKNKMNVQILIGG